MKNGWRVILVIVLVAILFGGVCLGVGMITGANMERIYPELDKRFNLSGMYHYITVDIPEALNKPFDPVENPVNKPADEPADVYQNTNTDGPAAFQQPENIE